MTRHNDIGIQELRRKIKNGSILYAGNSRLKIFGRFNCSSGKRMNKGNRIFFETETEAIVAGFRPCGHCMPDQYRQWKLFWPDKVIPQQKFEVEIIL